MIKYQATYLTKQIRLKINKNVLLILLERHKVRHLSQITSSEKVIVQF